ncbi:MAG: ABC transporter ATP-binding protein/permease [Anaerolineae bacterium]|nr:ABC transporter ATP-binding protein/permease [Anaerolineae bacterium]
MRTVTALARYLKPYWRWVLVAPLLMLLEVTMDLVQPRLVERIVDEGIARLDMTLILHTGLLMLVLAAVGALGGMSNGIFAARAVQAFGADLREAIFRRVQELSFGNLDAFGTGSLITRLTNDVTQVQEAIMIMLRVLVRAPLLMVGSLFMAILTSPQLTFLPLVLMPLVLAIIAWVIRRASPMFAEVQKRLDAVNTVMQENLAGVRVVKAFVRARHEEARFGAANDSLMAQIIRVGRTIAATMPLMMMTMNLGVVGAIWFGGVQVTRGNMQSGQIIAFVNYLTTTLFSLTMVSMLVMQVTRAQASAKRIAEVLETEPVVKNRPGALRSFRPLGRVAFEGVTFSYGNGAEPVLKDISFVAEPGQTVALLGRTGSGKSSLVQLIPRFYDVTSGRVTIDGVDVRDLDQAILRRSVAVVLQETVLFSGTIRDNIRYGRPDAPDEEVIAAARAAQAHDFIMSFPDGYDTVIGQRGVNLSGGQKQRIAIARALLVQPAVLILDDSTSSVDLETEARIQAALQDLMRGRTVFVVAQRISSVIDADKILVLDAGQIVAEGTHHELLASSPVYREIIESQLGNG